VNLDTLQAQPKLGWGGEATGGLRAADYEFRVRTLWDDNFAVCGYVLRNGGDDALASMRGFRADGLVDGHTDRGASWNRSRCLSQSCHAEAKR
jgi:hypothetical protein